MFNVRLAGGHLYGKQLFTWLSLVVSLMASFVLSFFPVDVLDQIWDLIESLSEGFLTYSFFPGVTINTYLLKLRTTLSRTSFNGSEGVQAIEVRLHLGKSLTEPDSVRSVHYLEKANI